MGFLDTRTWSGSEILSTSVNSLYLFFRCIQPLKETDGFLF